MTTLRPAIDAQTYADPSVSLTQLIKLADLSAETRAEIARSTAKLVDQIRTHSEPGLMEVFLAEYGLSTDEGVALMCLAEALLRVPDAPTIDALIEDKIAPSDWGKHLGHSSSSLVNASTWALMLTGKVLDDEHPGAAGLLRGAIKRLGEPVIRSAVSRAMKEMGRQFVLGETIDKAMDRAAKMQAKGLTYSYDMLGEAAKTAKDAQAYFDAYSAAITAIGRHATGADIRTNPGISIKLSALHPRYEELQSKRVLSELPPLVLSLAKQAKANGMGLNIDAEEADRLSLSLDVIERVLESPDLAGWDGFGVVVQAYGQRAGGVIEHLHELATRLDRKIMIRLVKGAYWDSEIKRAQVEGIDGFPVFTEKSATDVSYIANARRLLDKTDRIYPQFATHNAHTVCAVLKMAHQMNVPTDAYEFQRLHGMGEALHTIVKSNNSTRCRIYAPVGAHRDLLAYLVRRLLENGANSSFVNRIIDTDIPADQVAPCPFETLTGQSPVQTAASLFAPDRANSVGFDPTHRTAAAEILPLREKFAAPYQWHAATYGDTQGKTITITNPANPNDVVGTCTVATPDSVTTAFETSEPWAAQPDARAAALVRAGEILQSKAPEIYALLAREAGKTLPDAIGELREAIDFLNYYAAECQKYPDNKPRGIWVCISPWNFPLAIFTGQIAAALAAGNAVIAKPAPQTPLIAALAVSALYEAGVPETALKLCIGGADVGAAITSHPMINGVAFTGSTATAQIIRKSLAENAAPGTPLIAETGGINAMIVDSTALPEHAVRDIVMSAFRSAGQRCSALRVLYVQDDIADQLIEMLCGAMDELCIRDPWGLASDVGPLIDETAFNTIHTYIDQARDKGQLIRQLAAPNVGHYIPPTVLRVDSIRDVTTEIFGPVLHVARFKSHELDQVIQDINETGYGLTFGLHTRIDDRVQHIVDRVEAGNIYVNRNQIGAVVGSQPFGGEGLSGTGPKAGGPYYLHRFYDAAPNVKAKPDQSMPGPTGESNRLHLEPRKPILCLGPTDADTSKQSAIIAQLGGQSISGYKSEIDLAHVADISAVMWWGDTETAREIERALSQRSGPIIPLITTVPDIGHVFHERHVCIDTTAAGGNASLLAAVADAIE
ncbi:bifunctional proline dehydrogenase/L-glutamate gamma-semialdehyde dehydrogenase [Marivivens niveibacter]|uniref:Bifunctional protein PutA n=1 Tax=Marivivens niveibacter TaxID=1930667 RepID=A0A251X2B6_9RHOB|nr:bifunctional proline dehydrogenase/L-glutamate gamma-semialdehyde dehydrogenase PutA [Marivivens niveibacter]OUD10555.1 bifunctional proline dehydrogenase/L-glutamate gamma-semialdehyde dehydrogenase [Marivivens niveibacter]